MATDTTRPGTNDRRRPAHLPLAVASGLLLVVAGALPAHAAEAPHSGVQNAARWASPEGSTAARASTVSTSPITRAEVITRAQTWMDEGPVPYNQHAYYRGYRTDCSGYVSMAWRLPAPGLTTVSLQEVSHVISKSDLKAGDVLDDASGTDRHVVLFHRWVDAGHTQYLAYEQSGDGGTHHRVVPYPYFPGHGPFVPRRFDHIVDGSSPANPYSPGEVCGTGYSTIDTADLGTVGRVYLLWNAGTRRNCVVTLKLSGAGSPSGMSAYLQPQGSTRSSDTGSYSYYAGPVRAYAPGCVTWGGSVGSTTYTSPVEHCSS